eukprot:TCALIF_11286-PA protein Name:"Similar to RFC4 Replication factor C subunit 4 (Homo sapiens)" AED:0.30 eAED:0.30 QI:0/-1/0/1/-1/1/1/0/365
MEAFLKTGKLGQSSGASAAGSKKTSQSQGGGKRGPAPWVEKYRPRTVEDVAYQDEVVSVLKKSLSGADLPNLLFYGPPGTGKTSTILAAARDLFGDMYRERILELNASDERGISVIRDKVKRFAQLSASGRRPDGRPCPPFKVIILDEADSMTKDAQSALRRTMEKEGRSTKFCLICNYVSRIIEPLTSRCAKFRFKPLANTILQGRLEMIAAKEGIKVSEAGMGALLTTSEGDLRMAITTLQSCARLKSGGDGPEAITETDVSELSGVVSKEWLDRIMSTLQNNSYFDMENLLQEFMCEGYSISQLIHQIHVQVVQDDHLSDGQKSQICEALAVSESRLLDGANEYLQLVDISSTMMSTFAKGA